MAKRTFRNISSDPKPIAIRVNQSDVRKLIVRAHADEQIDVPDNVKVEFAHTDKDGRPITWIPAIDALQNI